MERKPPPEGDVQHLEQQLERARSDHVHADEIALLEQQLDAIRREQGELVRQFVHQHSKPLLVLAARLVGRHNAEDVAQEAFLCLTARIQRRPLPEVMKLLGSPTELSKLMYRITACRAYDHLRRTHSRKDCLTDDGAEIESTADERSMFRPHVTLEVERLERAYASLPPAQRIAHVLHYYYEFTDSDLEKTLGITKTNSRTLVSRANHALKRAMEMKQ